MSTLTIVIKNFFRNKMVNLTATSVRHFLPQADIYCISLFKHSVDEYLEQEPLHSYINNTFAQTKFISNSNTYDCLSDRTSGAYNVDNGHYFFEGYNLAYSLVKGLDTKVLILAEDHYFTTGETLTELLAFGWDVAYAPAFSDHHSSANGSIFGIVPTKVAPYFPLKMSEGPSEVEFQLGRSLLTMGDSLRIHRISTRIWDGWWNYCGDGKYTNSSELMATHLKEAGIL